MFSVQCQCGAAVKTSEAQLNQQFQCPACQRQTVCLSAEPLDADAAAVDFDVALLIVSGPDRVGQVIRLGGCATIDVGKQPGNHLLLNGNAVSRAHCKLVRLDFGPSRWQIEDKKSTNGVIVNGQRIAAQELQDGDVIRIGDYEMRYQLAVLELEGTESPEVAMAPIPNARSGTSAIAAKNVSAFAGPTASFSGTSCPSCDRQLTFGARVCVECGIRVPSGRPLLTSAGLDENVVHGNAEKVMQIVSWIVWVTPLPMPLASEAYGRHKPYAIWTISAITVLASVLFFLVSWNERGTAQELMLWPSHVDYDAAATKLINTSSRLRNLVQQSQSDPANGKHAAKDGHQIVVDMLRARTAPFHWYQLLTCAFLHDTNGIIGFILHLGGNMLFMIVFGSRVNAIIGNAATAIIYPFLAIASAGVFMMTSSNDQIAPLLGASGAINGLAGMYLILFPAHRVYCAMWLRFRLYLVFRIFTLRGFWVLLIYLTYDVLMVAIGFQGTTAHWAHIGGFITGAVIAIGLLASRMFDCRNGDLLSLILGKHAWPLIGKPNRLARDYGTAMA